MKKSFRLVLSVLVIVGFVIGLNACKKQDPDNIFAFAAAMDGSQAIPSNSTTGTGYCNVTFDSISNEMTYSISWKEISGAPSNIFFDAGTFGTASYLQIPITDFPLNAEGAVSGRIKLDDDAEAALLNSGMYITVATSSYGTGEVSGQLLKQ